ncbi:Rne/Rng family ribonuclease [Spongisporangium articulatum]|uniref:Rne/Rng family ribonuclease n=1 Tax=Spongisporangium articulatum TaxID=3362603 RepID=A0ABW8AKX9_9ACTN
MTSDHESHEAEGASTIPSAVELNVPGLPPAVDPPGEPSAEEPKKPARRRATRAAKTVPALDDIALPPAPDEVAAAQGAEASGTTENSGAENTGAENSGAENSEAPAKRTRSPRKRTTPRPAPRAEGEGDDAAEAPVVPTDELGDTPGEAVAEERKPARRSRRKASAPTTAPAAAPAAEAEPTGAAEPEQAEDAEPVKVVPAATALLFQAPEPTARRPRRAASRPAGPPVPVGVEPANPEDEEEFDAAQDDELAEELEETDVETEADGEEAEDADETDEAADGSPRRRRRRGGRGRRGRGRGEGESEDGAEASEGSESEEGAEAADEAEASEGSGSSRRRRRRRRRGNGGGDEGSPDDPPNTVTRVRESRRGGGDDEATGIKGSTRLEAKKQRRREGREAGRRRQVISEAEFLARRESVERVMVVREREGRTQIGVLEDNVLVEHYVARRTQSSMVGNVYLGRVQNVLPSMEAAFVDIGKGRNAVLYAGEVNWDQAGLDGQPRRIENALKAGESVLVQVTKDPIGHKGARLTSQISMPGRYLVYVPEGSMTGISRKLPENERARLKKVLKAVVPEHAGVIVRTAAEGASDVELERDVARLQAQWDDIEKKATTASAPSLLYGEPDLAIRVVRDIFNEDFKQLIISGDEAWDTLQGYIGHVAPDLVDRLQRWDGEGDVFAAHRIDEQLHKGLERKVWLPSGGSLVIDRTEAMTVIDVNTGKFTGSGGNLEETVTKNNLEAAEEVVRQLRLRDIGGIIVVDFIDMVLESNRDLVLRRLLECLGRDRTRHQVAEVTSLGLVQMTRKRVGQGLVEVFSETCEHCGGRGLILHDEPVEKKQDGGGGGGRRGKNN